MEHPARQAINKFLDEDRIRHENVAKAKLLALADIKASAVGTLDPNDLLSPLEFSARFLGLDERKSFVWLAWAKEFARDVVDGEARRLLLAHVQLTALVARNVDPGQTGVVDVKAALVLAASRFPRESRSALHVPAELQTARPLLPSQQQDAAILDALKRRGVDPLKMPKAPLGTRPWPLRDDIGSELGYSKHQMRHAWKRLRKDEKIQDDIDFPGLQLSDVFTGKVNNNTRDGDAGDDRLGGGTGSDTYVIDDAGDTVAEVTGEGTDTVRASVSYASGATGTASIDGIGNDLDNTITGNDGAKVLDGGAGADTTAVGTGGGYEGLDGSTHI